MTMVLKKVKEEPIQESVVPLQKEVLLSTEPLLRALVEKRSKLEARLKVVNQMIDNLDKTQKLYRQGMETATGLANQIVDPL